MPKRKHIASIVSKKYPNWEKGFVDSFWSKVSYTTLDYQLKPFNNPKDVTKWKAAGYQGDNFTGMLCDMNQEQPAYTKDFINWFERYYNAKNVGVSFFKMPTGYIIPTHRDTYKKYRSLFKCSLKNIMRVVVFLDDWKPGHVFEIDGQSITNYKKGDYVFWRGNTPHMAANIGLLPRYTMQITGHK